MTPARAAAKETMAKLVSMKTPIALVFWLHK